jgi:hypothetical protein
MLTYTSHVHVSIRTIDIQWYAGAIYIAKLKKKPHTAVVLAIAHTTLYTYGPYADVYISRMLPFENLTHLTYASVC